MEQEYEFTVGVDLARETHVVCVLSAERKVVHRWTVPQTGVAIGQFADRLAALAPPGRVAVSMEAPRCAMVDMLVERGFAVYHINPKQVDRFRDRHSVAGSKDDARDAFVLADAMHTDLHLFHRIHLDDDARVVLRELVRIDDELNRDFNAVTNRLQDQLARFFPQVLELSKGVDEPWIWEVLERAPSPKAVQKLKDRDVAAILKKHGIRRFEAAHVLKTLQVPPLQVSPGAAEAAQRHVALLLPRMKLICAQQADVEREVKALLNSLAKEEQPEGRETEHRDVTILLSLPGVGWKVSATLLVEAGEALARRDYRALRLLAGVAPVRDQTGGPRKKGRAKMRYAANTRLRNALFHWARVSAQRDPHAGKHYAELRKRGHGNARALRSVGDRNLRVACAMLRSGTLYDANRPTKVANAA